MENQKYIIKDESEYEEANERFRKIFHACPCITDNEEGMLLFDALEEYEKRKDSNRE